jgi:hypothetical protein
MGGACSSANDPHVMREQGFNRAVKAMNGVRKSLEEDSAKLQQDAFLEMNVHVIQQTYVKIPKWYDSLEWEAALAAADLMVFCALGDEADTALPGAGAPRVL